MNLISSEDFASCFVGIKQNLSFSYRFYPTIFNNGLREPYLLLTNGSFTLLLSESCTGMQELESQLNIINLYSVL